MWTDKYTDKQKALTVSLALATLAVLTATGLVLLEYGPGNMGVGFLQGGAVGLALAGVAIWRVSRRPESTTTLERAWTQTGDERDDDVLTRALAVLGLLSFPLTAAAAIAIALGAPVDMLLALLLFAEVAVGAVAFAVINRRS